MGQHYHSPFYGTLTVGTANPTSKALAFALQPAVYSRAFPDNFKGTVRTRKYENNAGVHKSRPPNYVLYYDA
jgi:hypothetical protein